jgi:hypothetical protein
MVANRAVEERVAPSWRPAGVLLYGRRAGQVRTRLVIDVDYRSHHGKIACVPGVFGHAWSIANGTDN